MSDVVYVLFPLIGKRFDPALVGVFKSSKQAREAEKKLHEPHPNHTTSFILELPICHDVDDYEQHWKQTIAKQVVDKRKQR